LIANDNVNVIALLLSYNLIDSDTIPTLITKVISEEMYKLLPKQDYDESSNTDSDSDSDYDDYIPTYAQLKHHRNRSPVKGKSPVRRRSPVRRKTPKRTSKSPKKRPNKSPKRTKK
jgi:hypothetical protein